MSTNTWPLPAVCLAGLLTDPLPTPAPANALFGGECGCCQITLHTSPPVTLLQEVLSLGAVLGDEDRVVSAAEEDTVTVGTLPPTTTWDEQDGGPTTSGCSSWLSPGKLDRPVMHGLVEVGNETSRGWEDSEYVSGVNAFRGHPVMGLKLYSAGRPIVGKLVGKSS